MRVLNYLFIFNLLLCAQLEVLKKLVPDCHGETAHELKIVILKEFLEVYKMVFLGLF